MLRSGRRPRFGRAKLCASVAALLLLLLFLSVNVLYSRLASSSHSHFSASEKEDSGGDRNDGLDHEANDEASRVSIDEHQILDGIRTEENNDHAVIEDSKEGSNKKNAGLFWDHETGVIRQAFDKRPMTDSDPWEDLNLDSELNQSVIVFSSDDQPLGEGVWKKLDEIKGVEDALLLRKGSSGALRDGWAPSFEKKGNYLRRYQMFRSSLEALNPLNNPLLQDPDMPGATTLTKGDKLLQKMIQREIKKIPFAGDLPVRIDVKKPIKRTFDDISSGNNAKKLNPQGEMDIQFEKHIYADGQRWGYFPGLDPHLSFSQFMDEFFRHGECSLRFFMVWNSPPWTFCVRHQRSLESLLYHHRDACVVVFSETIDLDFFSDFVKDGFKTAVVMPNLDELLKDTPTHAFASVWHEWRKTNHYFIHYSELMRLAALYKYGGLYLDFDVIVLKPLHSFKNSIAVEDRLTGNSSFNGAVMAFERHSPFIMECLSEFYSTYDDTRLKWNGANLLTRVVERLVSGESNSVAQVGLKIEPHFVFFPIRSQDIMRYFTAAADEAERADQDAFFREILDKSFTFHFWNSLTSALVPEPESLVERLLNHYCLRCLELL